MLLMLIDDIDDGSGHGLPSGGGRHGLMLVASWHGEA